MKILKVVIGKGGTPENCGECEETYITSEENYNHCPFNSKDVSEYYDTRHPDCPLVESEVSDGD